MSIVLSILQVIGIILLIILVVLLMAVLFVLFCPVCYLMEGEWLEEKWAKAKLHWLFHLLRLKVSYGDDLIYGEAGILWKRFTFSFDLSKKEDDAENDNDDVNHDTEGDEKNISEEKKESIILKIKGIIERIKEIYPKIKRIITDEKNQDAVIHIKKEIVYLIKILLPKKSKIDAVFSTGSPDTTGQLFGVLACFPAMYHKDWKLMPDFEADEAYFKGTFWGKGRVYGYQIVGIILRILFDKNCRRLYTIINRFIKWMKKGEKSEVK